MTDFFRRMMKAEQIERVRKWAQREIAVYDVPLDPILREEVAEVVLWLLEPDPVKDAAPAMKAVCEKAMKHAESLEEEPPWFREMAVALAFANGELDEYQ